MDHPPPPRPPTVECAATPYPRVFQLGNKYASLYMYMLESETRLKYTELQPVLKVTKPYSFSQIPLVIVLNAPGDIGQTHGFS